MKLSKVEKAIEAKKLLTKKKYEGSIFKSKSCGEFEVLEFIDCFNVRVRFLETGCEVVVASENMKRGNVKDYLARHTYSVGYLGSKNATVGYEPLYQKWVSMLGRCYSDFKEVEYYGDCTVSEHFQNFTNFRDWALTQKGHNVKEWVLDKDLLSNGDKIYSKETCCFIPSEINKVFNKRFTDTGTVTGIREAGGKFVARASQQGGYKHLGTFDTLKDAIDAQIKTKAKYLTELADLYKVDLEPKVYLKIVNWFN